ncbi:hypothetical protein [Fusobacterium varium]|uniref:ICEBs1 excisionase n=1 Tax=Fusobacterium varium ATCC 27725 TaxID=469618 RepID=A0ABM6U231_FUSVA|nr:hypothetical protein [Fusobacterium varium]AVQ30358.1 hypothetical protein C4N18_03595 [Fusobacterium varium ATCC 27725]EES64605.2 hypothetical protein FVAG_01288 [Fusobacterium varium ATCC 27725]
MKFLFAKDVMQITGLKITKSREIIRDLNGELKEKGYLTIQGRVPEKYFYNRYFPNESEGQYENKKK